MVGLSGLLLPSRRAPIVRGSDQLVNSASSALFSFGSVFLLSATEFGGLALQMVVLSLVLGLLRSSIFEAALFTRGDVDTRGFSWIMPRAGLGGGVIAGFMVAGVGLLIPNYDQSQSLAIAIVTLATLTADGVRYGAIAAGKPTAALFCDTIWLAGTLIGSIGLAVVGELTFEGLAYAYASAALVGLISGYLMNRRTVAALERASLSGLRHQRLFGADFALQVIPGQLVVVVAPLVIGLSGLGLYRAVVTLFQPLLTLATAIRLAVLDGRRDERRLAAAFSQTAYVLVALSVVYAGLALFATQTLSLLDRGALTNVPGTLIGIYGLAEIVRVGSQPWFDMARLRSQLRALLSIRAVQAGLTVVLSLGLGVALGTNGYAFARLLTAAVGATAILRVVNSYQTYSTSSSIGDDEYRHRQGPGSG